ncbi:hypothetical protein KC867_00530 [Candidatus Saccharibacteria bacterium]|nr:hypothetical protein [Candidatus Saccharibacteria bacterium]
MGSGPMKSSRGDTIIEVLLSIAIISGVLGMSYAVMNRNMVTIQDNSERTVASKIIQGDIELFRRLSFSSLSSIPASTDSNFCIDATMTIRSVSNATVLTSTSYAGGKCVDSRGTDYYKSIKRSADGGYVFTVQWNSMTGNKGRVIMGYRIN